MADTVGLKSLVFGSLAMKFAAEDGYDFDGISYPKVNTTADDAATMTYAAGDKPDWGEVKGTIIIDSDSIEALLALKGTSATLTISYNIATGSANTTNATVAGTAILLSAPEKHEVNGIVKGSATFVWTAAPTFTDAAV